MVKKKRVTSTPAVASIESSILLVRGVKVILDEDLARLYEVPTKALVQAVKRNKERFPEDFMFQLTTEEHAALRSQIVTSSGKTGRRYAPYAFSEHGVAMLSSVLNSDRAIEVNIAVVRAFVRMRELMQSHRDLAEKINALERRYDAQFKVVFNSIRELITAKPKNVIEVPPTKRPLGFRKG